MQGAVLDPERGTVGTAAAGSSRSDDPPNNGRRQLDVGGLRFERWAVPPTAGSLPPEQRCAPAARHDRGAKPALRPPMAWTVRRDGSAATEARENPCEPKATGGTGEGPPPARPRPGRFAGIRLYNPRSYRARWGPASLTPCPCRRRRFERGAIGRRAVRTGADGCEPARLAEGP